MKKSFFSTFIVLFFSFIFVFSIAKSVLAVEAYNPFNTPGMTPEKMVQLINQSPSLYLDASTRSQWNMMNAEQQANAMRTNSSLYLTDEYDIKVNTDAQTTMNPITAAQNAVKTAMDNALSSIGKVFTTLLSAAGVAILGAANLVLGLTGQFFDLIIQYTVTTDTLFNSIKEPVNVAWKILRDVANIAIVFSLLYLAIRTILNGNGFADTKTLAGVLVAAVLINFSLFFVTLAFNTSNFVARSISSQIVFSGSTTVTPTTTGTPSSQSISANIARMIGTKDAINKLWNQSFGQAGANAANNEWDVAFNDLRSGALAALTMMAIVVIFIIAAVLLLYRFFVFTILMITSPFGLVSAFIPWFKGMGKEWWGQLKHQFIYLPAFMLTLYIALLFIGTITSSLTPQTDTVTYFYYFFLTCGFLLMVLILPSKIAGTGGAFVSGVTNWGTSKLRSIPKRGMQFGGRLAVGGGARLGREVIGKKFANKLGGNTEEKRKALQTKAQGTGVAAAIARQQLRASEGLKAKTYDIRNTGYGKKLGLGAGIQNWNDTVESKKKALEERKKKEEKIFGFDQNAKTEENKNDIVAAEAVRNAQGAVAKKAGEDVKAAQTAYTKAIAANSGATDAEKADAKKKMEDARAIQEKELKALAVHEQKVGELKNKGDSDYLKLVEARNKRVWNRMSLSQKAAIKKMEEELHKKWKEDGKYKAPKEKKTNTAAPTVNISGTGMRSATGTGNLGGSTSTGTVNFGNGTGTPGSTATGTGNGTI